MSEIKYVEVVKVVKAESEEIYREVWIDVVIDGVVVESEMKSCVLIGDGELQRMEEEEDEQKVERFWKLSEEEKEREGWEKHVDGGWIRRF
jgi:hypothetical protein